MRSDAAPTACHHTHTAPGCPGRCPTAHRASAVVTGRSKNQDLVTRVLRVDSLAGEDLGSREVPARRGPAGRTRAVRAPAAPLPPSGPSREQVPAVSLLPRSPDSWARPPVFSRWTPGDRVCVLPTYRHLPTSLGDAARGFSARTAPVQAGPLSCPRDAPDPPSLLSPLDSGRGAFRRRPHPSARGPSAASPVCPPSLRSFFSPACHVSPRHLLTWPLTRCFLIVAGSAVRSPETSPGGSPPFPVTALPALSLAPRFASVFSLSGTPLC